MATQHGLSCQHPNQMLIVGCHPATFSGLHLRLRFGILRERDIENNQTTVMPTTLRSAQCTGGQNLKAIVVEQLNKRFSVGNTGVFA